MTRTEPDHPDSNPEAHGVASLGDAAAATLEILAATLPGERVAVVRTEGKRSEFAQALVAALGERGATALEWTLPADPAAAAKRLAAHLDADLPEAIVHLGTEPIVELAAVRAALVGNARLVELAGLDDAAAAHLLPDLDPAAIAWTTLAASRSIDAAERLAVRTAAGSLSLPIGPQLVLRPGEPPTAAREVSPPPAMRGQVATLPGLVAIDLARPASLEGAFLADRLEDASAPIRLDLRAGRVTTPGPWHDARVRRVGLGTLESARRDGPPIEASRAAGTISLELVRGDGRVGLALSFAADLELDGTHLVRRGRFDAPDEAPPPRPMARRSAGERLKARLARVRRLAGRLPRRTFRGPHGPIEVVGPFPTLSGWLAAFTGRPVAPASAGSVRLGSLRRAIPRDCPAVFHVSGPRARLERMAAGPGTGLLLVPLYLRLVLPLGPVRERGLDALKDASDSAWDDLRSIRTKRLGWRIAPLDAANARRFHEEYYVPTMVRRHGPEAAIRDPASLLAEVGRAECLEVIHEDEAVAMMLFVPARPDSELLQIGIRRGDPIYRKLRVQSLGYVLPAAECARRGAETYDFGRTPPFLWSPVLAFKSKWGAEVGPVPADERFLLRLPPDRPESWSLLRDRGLVCLRSDGARIGVAAADAASDLGRLREAALPGLSELVVLLDGVEPDAIAAALAKARHAVPFRAVPRAELARLPDLVG